jgi:hypothetical protein
MYHYKARPNTNFIGGKWWYWKLIPSQGKTKSLFDDYPMHTLENKILVGMETNEVSLYFSSEESSPTRKNGSRRFAIFSSYIELYNYQRSFPEDYRCFFEILLGDFPQKPHFDIDIKGKEIGKCGDDLISFGEKVLEQVIYLSIQVGLDHGIQFSLEEDILVFSSHNATKCSYHVVIDNWCHVNNIQAKGFYRKVAERLEAEEEISEYGNLAQYVDHMVYSSTQNFRLLGSQKPNSFRPKKYCPTFTYLGKTIEHKYPIEFRNEEHKQLEIFKYSLCSWTSGCKYLPSFINHLSDNEVVYRNFVQGDLTETQIKEGLSLLPKSKDFPFSVRDIKGNFINLKRERSSYCSLCQRVHDNDNAYLSIYNDCVYFYCRRNDNDKLFIGTIASLKDALTTTADFQ